MSQLWGKNPHTFADQTVRSKVFWVNIKEIYRRKELGFLYSGIILDFLNISTVKYLKMESETSGFFSVMEGVYKVTFLSLPEKVSKLKINDSS